jgi:glycosyltransferase involved in cell wall biosynthesis
MSMGLPAVVTDCGGNPLLIRDGENGLIVPCRDSDALAAALLRLMGAEGLRGEMSRRAVEIFEQQFTGKAFARKLEEIYCEVLKGAD